MVKVFTFRRKPGDDYWKVIEYIDDNGLCYISERGQVYKEAEPIVIEVVYPKLGLPSQVLPGYFVATWGEKFILEYAENVALCRSEPGQWSYSYGERLGAYDQLKKAIDKLRRHPDTRQATCVLYWPTDLESREPPCMVMVDFKIREDMLHTHAVFRSNDMMYGWPANYYELLMLSWRVIDELEIGLKKITTFSISAHIYVRSEVERNKCRYGNTFLSRQFYQQRNHKR